MEKFQFLIAAFSCAMLAANAQTEKCSQNLGLNLGVDHYKNTTVFVSSSDNLRSTINSKSTNFTIGPDYSYFIAKNLDIGVSLSYANNLQNYISSSPNNYNDNYPLQQWARSYSGLICLRKYFLFADKIGFRAGPYLGYQVQDERNIYAGPDSGGDYNSRTNNYQAGINLDLVYYPRKRLGISASIANLSYSHVTDSYANDGNGSGSGNGISFNFTNGLNLAVFYVFGS